MKTFVFRNNTIEFFFDTKTYFFSGYDDISYIPDDADEFIWFYQTPYGIDEESKTLIVDSYAEKFDFVYSQIPENKMIYVFTLVNWFNTKIVTSNFDFDHAVFAFNNHVIKKSKEKENIKIIDFTDFIFRYKKNEIIDWKYYFTSQLAFSQKLLKDFQLWYAKIRDELAFKRKKCLVLDLDNTVWGGVLGEDGIDGIKIGGDYPGKAFLYFQKAIIELEKSGVIIAICSKNNEQDVLDCWKRNPFNLINESVVSSYRINWNNKADNLRAIASELNIGLDSFVFIDDNPAERELIRQNLPEVAVPDFPEHPYNLPSFTENLITDYFRIYGVTTEDKNKTETYKANVKRKSEESKFTDMQSFIKSLNIHIKIESADDIHIPRIAQMTQKTNQFNLTTKRYTDADLKNMISAGAKIYCMSISDKFGDSGITGCIIIKQDEVDSLLLSCRILGKGIENEFLKQIITILKKNGYTQLRAFYIPTLRNIQVKNFYENNGFTLVAESDTGEKKYSMNMSSFNYVANDIYTVSITEE